MFSNDDFHFAKGLAAAALAFLPGESGRSPSSSPLSEISAAEDVLPEAPKISLLPRAKGWFVASRAFPANPSKCDFLDFFEAEDGRLIMILASVSGSGMSRALASVAARSTLKASSTRAKGPADALRAANRILKQDFPPGMFVSAAAFWMDAERRALVGANAGFGPCHLWRSLNRKVEVYHPKGIGMNIGPTTLFESSLEEIESQLDADDIILAISDGFAESSNSRGETLGDPRLQTWLERGGSSPEDFLAKLEREWRLFAGLGAPADDILMVAATPDRRKAPRGGAA